MEISALLFCGLCLRLGLILYGDWQDRTMAVKFTDIDYHVFNDAATYVSLGQSPYLRATYRYTPLLAWMLQPNILWTQLFGKLLFILLDIYTGYLIYHITLSNGVSAKTSKICAVTWILNPLPMTVSSRGNAESIMSCLVLLCLKLIQEKKPVQAAAIFALSVHFKIYPVIYALPIYLVLYNAGFDIKSADWKSWLKFLLPTKDRVLFVLSSVMVVVGLTLLFFNMYGWEFLQHTYLYHVTRKDIRHNFSVYFYLLYQQSAQGESIIVALLCFIPQVLLLVVFSVKFYKDLPLVFFLNTLAFVTFNKVCTSQYFLWYLCLLPLSLPQLTQISKVKAVTTIALWFAGQGIWLLPAYYLEFEGKNTFLFIWMAGIVFFLINCYVMYTVIDGYTPWGRGDNQQTTVTQFTHGEFDGYERKVPSYTRAASSMTKNAQDTSVSSSTMKRKEVPEKLRKQFLTNNSKIQTNSVEEISKTTSSVTKRKGKSTAVKTDRDSDNKDPGRRISTRSQKNRTGK